MAEENLSPETQAIVDRLVREGELLRNKGDHSIKSVKETLLNKFAPVFEQISVNTTQTAKSLSVMETYFTGSTEKLDTLGEEIAKMNDDQKKALEEKLKKEREEAIKKKENDRESMVGFGAIVANLKNGFEGLKNGFASIKKDPLGSLLNIGKWALILPLVAGAAKGLLDSIFGEDSVLNLFKDMYDSPFFKLIREHPWKSLGVALVAMAAVNWTKMYLAMMAAAKTMGVSKGTTVVGAPDVTGGKEKGGLKNRLKNILKMGKGKGLYMTVAAAGGLLLLGNMGDDEDIDMEAEVKKVNDDIKAKEIDEKKKIVDQFEKERSGFGDVILSTLGGAGVGLIGGLPGAIFGGITGLLTGLGQVAYEAYDDWQNDIDELPNELETLLETERNKLRDKRGVASKNNLSDKEKAEFTTKTNTAIKELRDKLKEQIYGDSGFVKDIEGMQALLEAGGEQTTRGSGRSKRKVELFTLADGTKITKQELEKRINEAEKERVLREKQLAATNKILESRLPETAEDLPQVETVEKKVEEIAKKVDEVNKKKPELDKSTEQRDRQQNVAAGGFALNIVNNYYNKGGDTVVTNQSDNRVSSNKSTGVVMTGVGGGSAFSSSLPNGAS